MMKLEKIPTEGNNDWQLDIDVYKNDVIFHATYTDINDKKNKALDVEYNDVNNFLFNVTDLQDLIVTDKMQIIKSTKSKGNIYLSIKKESDDNLFIELTYETNDVFGDEKETNTFIIDLVHWARLKRAIDIKHGFTKYLEKHEPELYSRLRDAEDDMNHPFNEIMTYLYGYKYDEETIDKTLIYEFNY